MMTEFYAQLSPQERALLILGSGILIAVLFELFVRRVLLKFVQRTNTVIDDEALRILRHPMAATAVLMAGENAIDVVHPPPWVLEFGHGVLETMLIIIWARVFLQAGHFFLEVVARPDGPTTIHIHPRSIPVFDFVIKLGVYAIGGYLGLAAWGINATAMAASFGVVGIAVGFAAQESLANLFAGVLIIADAPYQIGDLLELDNGDRGEVVEIGIRSTRLLTTDGVEIIVPNSIMANTKVFNETGGPMRPRRIHVPIGVAYGVDLAHVRTVLVEAMAGLPMVLAEDPGAPPKVVVRGFGESSVDLEVLVWIFEPRDLLPAFDVVNTAIYDALNEAGIEIPYPKRDVHLYASATTAVSAGRSGD